MFVATSVDSAEVVAFLPISFVVGGLFWVAASVHYRAINRDMPVSSYQRKLMRYWTWFVIGCGYALIFPAIFREPNQLGVLLWFGMGADLVDRASEKARTADTERARDCPENGRIERVIEKTQPFLQPSLQMDEKR
jgi:hypothetical protein